MRTGAKVFLLSALFSATIGAIYLLISYEWAGTSLLLAMGTAPLIVAVFLFRATGGAPSPEDRDDADPGEGAGPLGTLPHGSLWPVVLAGGASLAAGGLVFGSWLVVLGLVVATVSVIGWMRESAG